MSDEQFKDMRPSYVRFEKIPVEDRDASIKAGHYVTKDQEHAIITPPGSKDEIVRDVKDWLAQMDVQVKDGRLPPTWRDAYKSQYEAWKRGEELPLEGTPIKGWPVLSPSQSSNCIAANIRTVEDLAKANGEALTRIGMGAQEMKQKAESWLKAAREVGTVVQENTALKAKNRDLTTQVENLTRRNEALAEQVKAQKGAVTA